MQLLPQPRTGESAAGVKVGLCALLSDVAGPVLVPFVLDQHKVSHVKMASVEQRLPATVHDNVGGFGNRMRLEVGRWLQLVATKRQKDAV